MLYRIERITDLRGKDKTDPRTLSRIGREGFIQETQVGNPMVFQYADDLGTLVTTPVDKVLKTEQGLAVRTSHAIYYLAAVEKDPDYPELIDYEEDD